MSIHNGWHQFSATYHLSSQTMNWDILELLWLFNKYFIHCKFFLESELLFAYFCNRAKLWSISKLFLWCKSLVLVSYYNSPENFEYLCIIRQSGICKMCILNIIGYQYHSMADTDWGWKKRAELTNEDDHERPISLYQNYLKKKARGGYKHRPYYGYVVTVTLKVSIGKTGNF